MARYEVNATNETGTSGEGPFYYTADSAEHARQQYIDWASTAYGDVYLGPARPDGDETPSPGAPAIDFPIITATLVPVP